MYFTSQSTTFIYSLINKTNNCTQKITYLDHTDLVAVFFSVQLQFIYFRSTYWISFHGLETLWEMIMTLEKSLSLTEL